MIMISHDSALLYWRIASFGRRIHRAGNRRSVQSLKVPTDEEVKLAWDCCYHPGQFEGRAFNFGSRDSSEELVYKASGPNGEIESSENTDRDRDFDEFEGMPCALQAGLLPNCLPNTATSLFMFWFLLRQPNRQSRD